MQITTKNRQKRGKNNDRYRVLACTGTSPDGQTYTYERIILASDQVASYQIYEIERLA